MNNFRRIVISIIGCMLCVLAVFLASSIQGRRLPPSEPGHLQQAGRVDRPLEFAKEVPDPKRVTQVPKTIATTDRQLVAEGREEILEIIEDTAVSYDPANLPTLRKYLLHEELEIREAAREAMIVLGDSSAAEMLRQASTSAVDPREAVALIDAAEYLELPPGRFRSRVGNGKVVPLLPRSNQ